jgi:transposase-like protein
MISKPITWIECPQCQGVADEDTVQYSERRNGDHVYRCPHCRTWSPAEDWTDTDPPEEDLS